MFVIVIKLGFEAVCSELRIISFKLSINKLCKCQWSLLLLKNKQMEVIAAAAAAARADSVWEVSPADSLYSLLQYFIECHVVLVKCTAAMISQLID